jgi:hypothetical protein
LLLLWHSEARSLLLLLCVLCMHGLARPKQAPLFALLTTDCK